VGEISQPVKTEFGYHIIQLQEVRGGAQRSFDESRAELAGEIRSKGSQDRFFALTEKMDDAALENPGSLDAAAKVTGLPIRHVDQFTRAGGEPFGTSRAVIDAAFSNAVVAEGENSPLIQVADGRAVILRVAEHRPARLRPIDEVRADVEKAVKAEKASQLAAARGSKIIEQARGGGDLATAAGEFGLKLVSGEPLARNSQEVPPEVLASIFSAAHPETGKPVFGGIGLPGGGYAVYRIDEVMPGKPEDIQREQRDARKNLLSRQAGVGEVTALAVDLRKKAKVVIAPTLFEQQDNQ
jgi:peptidyl-prolyl cis-trans isomerase D